MPAITIKEIVDHAAASYSSQDAVKYKVRKEIVTKTYQNIKQDSEAFSRSLEALNLLGGHVAVIGSTTYEWMISYLGTVNSAGVAVPIDAGLPAADVCDLINRADVSCLVYDEVRADVAMMAKNACPGLKYIVSMQASEDADGIWSLHRLLDQHAGTFDAHLDPDSLCTIMFTSGTTGKSKGVMLTHRNLAVNATVLDMKIPTGTVSMTLLPIHHAYCLSMDVLKALYIGMVICINDSIMHVSKNMKLFKPEIVLLVPLVIESIYNKLEDTPGLLPKKMVAKAAFGGNLKTICSGGAYLDPVMVEKFSEYGITILQGYGMTECAPVISTNLAWDSKIGSVGKLMPNCEAKIVDEEIWVRGSSVMMGYYQMPEETEATLEDGWLKTGDLGYVDEDDFIFITGRKKNLIILPNGENVSPEELENVLSKSHLIKEVVVAEKEQLIQAFIFPDHDYAKKKRIKNIPAALQELIDAYNEDKPPYKRIHGLTIREEEFEKTPSKKIKRNLV